MVINMRTFCQSGREVDKWRGILHVFSSSQSQDGYRLKPRGISFHNGVDEVLCRQKSSMKIHELDSLTVVPIIRLATLDDDALAWLRSVRMASSIPVVTSVPVVALKDETTAAGPVLVGSRRTASVLVPIDECISNLVLLLSRLGTYHRRLHQLSIFEKPC